MLNLVYLQKFGYQAYLHIQNTLKLDKIKPQAYIGYLVSYDSTNIFQIWIPSQEKVILTWDVMFDKRKQYDPTIYEIPTSKEIVDTIKAPRI